jgi:cell shape-determining protein MreC
MDVIKFPRRQRNGRDSTHQRPFELVKKMIRDRVHEKNLAVERRRLLVSMQRLERLTQELESIQRDLERLRSAFRGGHRKS